MGYEDRREILERLEALEHLVRSHLDERRSRGHHRRHREHGHGRREHHHHDGDRGGEDFQEKRVIDTIVRLVSEQVGRIVQDQQARSARHDEGRHDGGFEEKRIVDLIVRLVCEHVQEIVAAELDRRGVGRTGEAPQPGDESQGPCAEDES